MARHGRPLVLAHVNRPIKALFFVATTTPLPLKSDQRGWKGLDARLPASLARWLMVNSVGEHMAGASGFLVHCDGFETIIGFDKQIPKAVTKRSLTNSITRSARHRHRDEAVHSKS
jgi:hypothetical protein